jgi:hypothetical protein
LNNNCQKPFINNCCNNRRCCNHRPNCCCNNIVPIPGPTGPAGSAATVTVGRTTTSASGTNASVTNSGTINNAVLNFTIPRGEPGSAATINVGTTTTLPPGSNATVTNVGTPSNAILNFAIPSGSTTHEISSGSFISRTLATYNSPNSIIALPITFNSEGITINNNVITIIKSGRYLINYGIKSTTIGNEIGLYINGINNQNTNIGTLTSDLNPSSSIILELNNNDTITLEAINASASQPLTLQENTINAYITILSLN